MLKERCDAIWQSLSVDSRTCPSEDASLFIPKHVLTGQPVSTLRPSSGWHCQNKCVQAFLRFKMSSHSLPCITTTGRVTDIPTAYSVCTLCQNGNLGVEQHLVFVCPALQGVRDNRMVYLMIMPLRWFKACGSMTIVLLRNLSKKCGRTQ